MNRLVKILSDDSGERRNSPKWCLVNPNYPDGSPRTYCSGEAFGEGESAVVYKEKWVSKGGITCPLCLRYIKVIKSVKL